MGFLHKVFPWHIIEGPPKYVVRACHSWVMSLKPLEVGIPITELPTLVEKKVKEDGQKQHTRTNVITHK